MASLREIRRKIQSVKSTQQITRAMKMVAAARMRKAQSGILDSRPFAVKMEGTVSELAALELEAGTLGATCVCARRFFGIPAPEGAAPEAGAAGLLLVTADKGLCGAFNANLLRAALRWIRNQQGRRIAAAAVGRKGREFLRRISDLDIEFLTELTGIFPKVSFAHAELVAKPLLERFQSGELASLTVIFTEFRSVASRQVVVRQFLVGGVAVGAGSGSGTSRPRTSSWPPSCRGTRRRSSIASCWNRRPRSWRPGWKPWRPPRRTRRTCWGTSL